MSIREVTFVRPNFFKFFLPLVWSLFWASLLKRTVTISIDDPNFKTVDELWQDVFVNNKKDILNNTNKLFVNRKC